MEPQTPRYRSRSYDIDSLIGSDGSDCGGDPPEATQADRTQSPHHAGVSGGLQERGPGDWRTLMIRHHRQQPALVNANAGQVNNAALGEYNIF